MNILLNNEAAVNILRSSDHASPLYLACKNGHESIAKLLLVLDNGADRNLKTTNGLSSLAIAYQNGNNGIQKLFQNIWININFSLERNWCNIFTSGIWQYIVFGW